MFTGLVEEIGTVKSVRNTGNGLILQISADSVLDGTGIGDSITINGACQTVTEIDDSTFSVFVSTVTASVTTLGGYKPGRKVNLERAMSHESRFGGHIVQGHVDCTGLIKEVRRDSHGIEVSLSLKDNYLRYIVEKGSVAVDGISLTIVSVDSTGFILYIIPETLNNTIVSQWKAGDEVNIEVDILAKYVEKMLIHKDNDSTQKDDERLKKKLAEEGYI